MTKSAPPRATSSRVLVVIDDDDYPRYILERELAETEWQLEYFRDAEVALEYVAANKPSALLVDILMPRIDGDEVLDELAQHRQLDGVRVLVTSGVEPPSKIWARFEKHGATFIGKDDLMGSGELLRVLSEG